MTDHFILILALSSFGAITWALAHCGVAGSTS